jgi:hypothetical protein
MIVVVTAIDMYLNQISLTGGIRFAVTLPKAPQSVNADFMTEDEIHAKLQEDFAFDLRCYVIAGYVFPVGRESHLF